MKKGFAKSSSRRSSSPKLVKKKTKHDEIYWGRWSQKKTWLYLYKVVILLKDAKLNAEIREWYDAPCIPEKCTNKERPNSCPFRHNDGSSAFEFQIMDGTLTEANNCAAGFNYGVTLKRKILRDKINTKSFGAEESQATDPAYVIGLERALRFGCMKKRWKDTKNNAFEVAYRPPPAHLADPPQKEESCTSA